MTAKETLQKTAARTRELEAKAREQFVKADVRVDSALHRLAEWEWTIPALGVGILGVFLLGFGLGKVF